MNDKIGNSSGSNSCISPFGVKLKCTPGGGCAGAEKEKEKQQRDTVVVIHKRLQEDEAAEKKLSNQRCNLRKVPGPSPSIVRRERRMERKPSVKTYIRPGGVNEPFMLLRDKAPVFGLVLRSTKRAEGKEEEQEEYLDLDFGGSRSSPTADAKEELFPFGVRLKPTRQQHNHHPTGIFNRAYQIDLSPPPPSKCNNNTYLNEHPRSVLEIKLRPIEKSSSSGNNNNDHDDQQLVELQLRHVVAPEDGGPKHVTQALLLVPLKKVPSLLNRGSSASHLQDLLQLTIHSPRGRHDSHVPEFLQIRLRHVDPATRQTHDASQVIDLKLNHVIPQKANIDTHPLSMQVTLRHVERVSRPIQAWVPEFANIQLKSVARCQEKHVDEEEETEYDEHDEEEDEDAVVEKEAIVEECASEQQAAANEAPKEPDKPGAGKEEAEEKRKVKFGDVHDHQDAATKAAEAEAESNKNARQAAKEEKERQRRQAEEEEQRAREERERLAEEKIRRDEAESRRLQHEIDTLKREAEEWARNKKLQEEARLELERQAAEQAERDLQKKREERHEKIKLRRQLSVHEKKAILERREGAYLYWQKLNRPTRQHFKETIHLLGNTGITNQDIDFLPWMMNDTFVDIRLMNEAAVKGDAFWGTIVEKLFESESESASSSS